MGPAPDLTLPRAAWIAVIRGTALIIGISVVISVGASSLILGMLSGGINEPGIAAAALMPILLGTPMMFYMMLSRQKLKHLNRQLHELASVDWLTGCLNRRAFTGEVNDRLRDVGNHGALLILDADHFKSINDRFGHERGDEALKLMADAIRSAVRPDDVIGRLGGEEFGVFLSDADAETAATVAERLRWTIASLRFAPNGTPHPLTVSVGGVTYAGGAAFSDLFRVADARLYGIKHSGRNRVDLAAPVDLLQSAA